MVADEAHHCWTSTPYDECKAKVVDFFQVWKSTRDRICEVDQGICQNASCTDRISLHVLHIVQLSSSCH